MPRELSVSETPPSRVRFGSNLNDTQFILPTIRTVRSISFDFVARCKFDRLRGNSGGKEPSRSSG